jgi:hypothetical protein
MSTGGEAGTAVAVAGAGAASPTAMYDSTRSMARTSFVAAGCVCARFSGG